MLSVVGGARVRAGEAHAAWSGSFNELFAQVAGAFGNAAVRRPGRAYPLGLLSQTERKNGWTLAGFAGDTSPDGLQRLLNFSPWDEGACRDAVRRYVAGHLGDRGAVLAAGETGSLKWAGCRLVWPGEIRARPGGWRTARWGCSWRTRPRTGAGR